MTKTMKKGFTLIELLVVVAIIGILAAMVLVALGGARGKARDAQRKSDLRSIKVALESYYTDQTTSAYISSATAKTAATASTALAALATGKYIKTVPAAPTSNSWDVYQYTGNNAGTAGATGYMLNASLENQNDQGTGTTKANSNAWPAMTWADGSTAAVPTSITALTGTGAMPSGNGYYTTND